MAAHASGAVLLDAGDIAGASRSLRQAWDIWRDLEMPYEEGHTCLLWRQSANGAVMRMAGGWSSTPRARFSRS